MPGADDHLLARSRSVLIDALEALSVHRDAVVVIGAQAVYLHTGDVRIALAPATKDSDLAVDVRELADQPLLEVEMRRAGFEQDPISRQPGRWLSSDGVPVDLMVPEELAGGKGSRSARIPPHDKHSARRAPGLEAARGGSRPHRDWRLGAR